MTSLTAVKAKAAALFEEAPFLAHIDNQQDYQHALALMDQLIEDYDASQPLIDILSVAIEHWEDRAEAFSEFNTRIASLPDGVAVLRTLMDQHQLKAGDLREEIGGKSLVSMILNHKRKLTLEHINALAKRFQVSPALFLAK
ncbi:transcriptional regulator [Alcanivorax sp. S6407]|uniref:helix-turn-helix domain-containing protein n=1 Tax=Alcanivorax sp. S6407 TaxID=2926424 RepID=UPI001FF695AF|nr:transcriptional regulator [Alcanivorax sp. S6407]MCK0154915.1 transcriptional regulator [Alcanivorax sp. S6407]